MSLIGIDLGTTFSRHRHAGRPRPARHRPQPRRRHAHALAPSTSRRTARPSSARRRSTWRWSSPTASPPSSSGAWACPTSAAPVAGREFRPETLSAIILRKLVAGRRAAARPGRQARHHRPGLLRRHPPQGDQGRRPHRRAGRPRHPRRADRRGPGLLVPVGHAVRSPRRARPAADGPRLRPRRRHLRRDAGASSASSGSRCSPSRATCGSAARTGTTASSNYVAEQFRHAVRRRPARRPAVAGHAPRRRRAGQAARSASWSRRASPCTHAGHRLTVPLTAGRVRDTDPRPARPHPADDAAGAAQAGSDVGPGGPGAAWSAARRTCR